MSSHRAQRAMDAWDPRRLCARMGAGRSGLLTRPICGALLLNHI